MMKVSSYYFKAVTYIIVIHYSFQSYIISFYSFGNSVGTYTNIVILSILKEKQFRTIKGAS